MNDNETATEIRHCLNCIFSREVPLPAPDGQPLIGQTMHTCQRMPPSNVLIPQPGGFSVGAMFPTVTENISCAEHRMKGETHHLIDGLPEKLIN